MSRAASWRLVERIDSETLPVLYRKQMRDAPDPFTVGELLQGDDLDDALDELAAYASPLHPADCECPDCERERRSQPAGYVPGLAYDALDPAPASCEPRAIAETLSDHSVMRSPLADAVAALDAGSSLGDWMTELRESAVPGADWLYRYVADLLVLMGWEIEPPD